MLSELREKMWDGMRNPNHLWARLVVAAIFIYSVWLNDWNLIWLSVFAALVLPYFFKAPKKKTHIVTKAVDGFCVWHDDSSLVEKWLMLYMPTLLAIPMLHFLWINDFFWAMFFIVMTIGSRILLMYWTSKIS